MVDGRGAAAVAGDPGNGDPVETLDSSSSFTQEEEILLRWIRQRIKVAGFEPSMWTDEHSSVAAEFLRDASRKSLFVAVDFSAAAATGDDGEEEGTTTTTEEEEGSEGSTAATRKKEGGGGELVVQHTSPPPPNPGLGDDVAFFVRRKGQRIAPENVSKIMQFGTFALRQDAASVLTVMEQVVYPHVFLSKNEWSQATRREISALYHKSMASLRESANEDAGRTLFYVPICRREGGAGEDRGVGLGSGGAAFEDAREAAKDRDLVQQFESIVIHWTRQVKSVLNSCRGSSVGAGIDGGPMDEIALWNARAVDLAGIADQLGGEDVRYVISVLEHSKSNYLGPLSALSEEVEKASREAASNIRFLDGVLSEPCRNLEAAKLEDAPALFLPLVNCVRAICGLSPHYNTTDHAAGLLRKLSNEIARKCREHISLEEVFGGDEGAAIESLRESVGCCLEWKTVCRKTATSLNRKVASAEAEDCDADEERRFIWDFGDDQFAQVDAFVQRCRDLIDICEGRMQFMVELDALEFSGTNGDEIKRAFKTIGESFHLQVKRIQQLRYDILDIRHSSWHEDYNSFKVAAKDLDVMYTNVINKAFGPVKQLDTAVCLLDKFWDLARRETIRRCVENHAAEVRLLFLRECQVIRQEFDDNRREPPLRMNEPQYAGSALWARSLQNQIRQMWSRVQKSSCPIVQNGDEAERVVESLLLALNAYQTNRYSDWAETLSSEVDDIKLKLEQPLLRRLHTASDSQLNRPLACNFDTDLLALFSEVVCWERLHVEEFEIPSAVLSICHQREVHRVAREHVTAMVRSFNELLGDLVKNESSFLFADHIRRVEKKIHPGLSKLTWTSRVVERFVQACLNEINSVHALAKRFFRGMDTVALQCRKISSLSLVRIDRNARYIDNSFQNQQEDHRNECISALKESHGVMSEQLADLYDIFQDCTEEVKARWVSHVSKIDTHLLESLSTSVKRSLTYLCTAISGDEGTGDTQTLFYLSVILRDSRVETKPSLIDLTHTVNSVAKEMIGIVQTIPCLEDRFVGDGSLTDAESPKFYDTISSNEAILNLVVKVMEGIAGATADISQWLLTWNRYKSLWDMDKDSFLRRYGRQNHPVATFDRDINTHKQQQALIESESTSHTVKFIKLETHSLRAALVKHSVEWQEKLLGLFQRNAEADLKELGTMLERTLTNLMRVPRDIAQLRAAIDLTSSLKGDMQVIENRISDMEVLFRTLLKYEAPVSTESKEKLDGLRPSLEVMREELAVADSKLDKCKALFKNELRSSLTEYCGQVRQLRDNISKQIECIAPDLSPEDMASKVTSLRSLTEAKRKQERNMLPGFDLFGIEPPDDKPLRDSERLSDFFDRVCKISKDWDEHWSCWNTRPIKCLDAAKMEESAQSALKNSAKLKREAITWPIFKSLQIELEQARSTTIPMVAGMNDAAMRQRHWALLQEAVGRSYNVSRDMPLSDVLGLIEHSAFVVNLSSNAREELKAESCLESIKTRWENATAPLTPCPAGRQICSAENILAALEKDSATLVTIRLSEHCLPFQDSVQQLEQNVLGMKNMLESLLSVQGKCQHIFGLLSGKARDESWHCFTTIKDEFMVMLGSNDDVELLSLYREEKSLLSRLLDMESKLENIQSSL